MAINTGSGRTGSVKKRSQVYNEKTNRWIKIDTETGKFMTSKKTPYKSVKKKSPKQNTDSSKSNKK